MSEHPVRVVAALALVLAGCAGKVTSASSSSSSSGSTAGSSATSGSAGASSSASSTSGGSSSGSNSGTSSSSGSSSSTTGGSSGSSGSSTTGGSGTTYYVSPSGSDSHDGLSPATAWQTVDKVNASTFQAGDTVRFEGGQSFSGCLQFSSTNVQNASASAPFTVDAYGSGSFTLSASCSGAQAAAVDVGGVSGFTLRHATLVGNSGGAVYGVWIHSPGGGLASGITVEDCDIGGFYVPGGQAFGGEIFITGIPGPLDQVTLRNDTLHGLSGPGSLDDNGVAGFGNGKNITHVLYEGNVVYDIGGKPNGANGCEGNGIIANGVDGAVMQDNVAHDLGGNVTTCGGAAAFWAANANDVTIQHNEAYRVGPISYTAGCDWDGFDLDLLVTNSVIQYNYSHDNYGVGFLLYGSGTWGPNTIRYNISQNDGAGLALGGDSNTTMPFAIYNNTIYDDPQGTNPQNQLINLVGGIAPQGYVANNILFQTARFYGQSRMVNSNGLNLPDINYLNNLYYSPPPATSDSMMFNTGGQWYQGLGAWQAAGNDPMARSSDPLWVSGGSAGTCGGYSPSCLAGYQLQSGSPALGSGLDLTQAPYSLDVGTSDFFGNPLQAGRYNLGAYGGN